MAVDTKQKRQSVFNYLNAFMPRLQFPDAVIGQGNMQAALMCYSGILAGAISAVPPNSYIPLSVHHTQSSKSVRHSRVSRVVKGVDVVKIVK